MRRAGRGNGQTVNRPVSLLLNLGHALDHLFLLIFATAVAAIANDFGLARWEDLMPFTTGAFVLFGLGSLPAGRLGDLWGRRRMMLIFFFGIGTAAIAVAFTDSPWSLAAALTVLGAFSAIYHPVGIPMLLQHTTQPGTTIGVNGLAGNLGIALAAVSTGFWVEHFDWRTAFVVPGLVAIAAGVAFARLAPREAEAPIARPKLLPVHSRGTMVRVLGIMIVTATTSSLLFNFTTNGNGQMIAERFDSIVTDPSTLGAMLAAIYTLASFSQLIVGRLIDRFALKPLFVTIAIAQVPLFGLAVGAQGWSWLTLAALYMAFIFASIPFSDTLVARYVDDSMRSRVSGLRLAVSFSISSVAVWGLGPMVKASGFDDLLRVMALISAFTVVAVLALPTTHHPARMTSTVSAG